MDAFFGEFDHSLDDKGRLILPAKFRDALAGEVVIAAGQAAKCLAVYKPAEWERVVSRTMEMAEDGGDRIRVARTIFALSSDVKVDRQGRVPIPASLREHAGLTREVSVIGAASHVEIWDAQLWLEERAQGQALLTGDSTLPGILV